MDVGHISASHGGFHLQQYALWSAERLYHSGFGGQSKGFRSSDDVCQREFHGDRYHCCTADDCIFFRRFRQQRQGIFLGCAYHLYPGASHDDCELLQDEGGTDSAAHPEQDSDEPADEVSGKKQGSSDSHYWTVYSWMCLVRQGGNACLLLAI